MTRLSTRTRRKPKAARENQTRAATVFRDFVRQLEKLDGKPPKPAREAAR
ncbi:MAG: hypothetical protein K0R61_5004 [Microvirga sp.]|nr:hypothetical protein [Microvirga sp.]MDF2689588.1 hypothetical protein [Microvirga sp.]MDF2974554.1 hypothetical protein [Microvirga sp.]